VDVTDGQLIHSKYTTTANETIDVINVYKKIFVNAFIIYYYQSNSKNVLHLALKIDFCSVRNRTECKSIFSAAPITQNFVQ